ncbi:MAG TPA: AarF/UbiB family protein [Ktedonobacterales bacterium]|nr:AarF/UbiB family protein [Ktedonobacterales bacterium]
MNIGFGDITPFSSLLAFIGTLTGTILLGSLASRMLGIRQSWGRTLLVGFLGFAAGATFSLTLQAENLPLYGRVFVFTSSITVSIMLISVAFELVGRSAGVGIIRPRPAGVPHPLRATRRQIARWARYLQITSILARYGLSPYFRVRRTPSAAPRTGGGIWARVRGALEEAGGAFVKFGQVLSTRPDVLPPDAIAELSGLQDHVTTARPQDIEALLSAELGDAPTKVFAAFDAQPLAAASIAQVYSARLHSGEQAIVKVQRPGIREPMECDLDIMLRLARTLEASAGWARSFGVVDLAQGFAEALREEIDFRIEARNLATVGEALDSPSAHKKRGEVRIPRVFPQLSTSRVLVIERFDGVSVREADPIIEALALDRLALARALLRCFLRQILRDGTFHADPHPGNVWVLRDGSLALLDFGSVGRLDPLQRASLQRMLIGLDRRDATMLSEALLDIALKRADVDADRLERSLAQLMAQRLGPGMSPGPELFAELFALFFEFGLAFPPVVGGVFRALVTLQGTLGVLAPDFHLIDEARALGTEWVKDALSPTSLRKAATDELLNLMPLLQRLPRRLDRITTALEHGTLSANMRLFADERDRLFLSRLVSRAVLAFLGASLGFMGALFLGMQGGPALADTISVYQVFGYAGLFLSATLILRVIVAIVREKAG